jgi:hypothetical protein
MWRKRLATKHRRIADREHADERRLLNVAPKLADPARVRAEARKLSESAERHRLVADEVEERDPDADSAQPG